MILAIKWLEKKYPKEGMCIRKNEGNGINNFGKKRSEIFKLRISEQKLEGILNLSDFVQLEELYCRNNQLIQIILPSNNKLKILGCSNNLLTTFDYDKLNPHTLTELWLYNNNLASTDLKILSPLINLVNLAIGNEDKVIEVGKVNKFFGSLESLKNSPNLSFLTITNTEINQGLEYLPASLKTFSYSSLIDSNYQVKELEEEIKDWRGDWKNLGCWKRQKFSLQEAKNWTKAGAKTDDYEFVTWLRDIKQETPTWIINYQTDYQILSERFKKYGLCQDCQQPHTGDQWCQACNAKHSETRLAQLNKSGNPQIDQFIQQLQLQATEANKFLEWIPYQQFTQIEYLAQGGFGQVYQARWTLGNINHWDQKSKQWKRTKDKDGDKELSEESKIEKRIGIKAKFSKEQWERKDNLECPPAPYLGSHTPHLSHSSIFYGTIPSISLMPTHDYWSDSENYLVSEKEVESDQEKTKKDKNYREVVLKTLTNSQSNADFLDEAAKHKIIDDWFNNLVPCYGLSQDPEGNYLMVMKYLPERDLRHYLKKNQQELKEKLIKKEEFDWKFNIEWEWEQEIGIALKVFVVSVEKKLKTEILSKANKKKIELLFKNLPIDKTRFLTELDKVDPDLSKEKTIEKLTNELYKIKSKLNKLEKDSEIPLTISYQKEEKNFQKRYQKTQKEIEKNDSEIANLEDKLSIEKKVNQLLHIVQGLKDIHQKNLVHRDFHTGNILKGIEQTSCLITDLGLCKTVDQITREEKIFGVLPYVAPEVLQGQPYTQAADIYSWAIVATELLTGLPPFYDCKHDVQLGVEICQGLRPHFQIQIPSLLENLIKQCWDNDPQQRPNAQEIEKILRNWKENKDFQTQLQATEKHNQNLSLEIRFPNYQIHYGAVYHSKLLPTQEITRILSSTNLSTTSTLVNNSQEQIIFPTKQITQLLNKIEVDQKTITEELKELAREFIRTNQANPKDKTIIKSLKQELKNQGFSRNQIEKIIIICEEMIESKEEQEKTLVQQVEVLTIKE